MNLRVNGTDCTRNLIKGVIGELQKGKPSKKHIDYSISLRNGLFPSTLITNENNGQIRNVSLVQLRNTAFFSGIRAAIGNETGNVLIHNKPFHMSTRRAVKKIQDFLRALQPKNEVQARRISTLVKGSDGITSFEAFKLYKTL